MLPRICVLGHTAVCWPLLASERFVLATPFRQKDARFLQLLAEVRHGTLSEATARILQHGTFSPRNSISAYAGSHKTLRLVC